jgi:hypothetical protein
MKDRFYQLIFSQFNLQFISSLTAIILNTLNIYSRITRLYLLDSFCVKVFFVFKAIAWLYLGQNS